MAKDDIVIGLGRPMYGSSVHANRKKAYPSVITTLGHMEKEVRTVCLISLLSLFQA